MATGLNTWIAAGLIGLSSAGAANATMVVISDVDALKIDNRTANSDLLENVRGGATDILWLTGGYDASETWFTGRYSALNTAWTDAGATIVTDSTAGVAASVDGRDLVVITQHYDEDMGFDSGAIAELSAFVGGGGDLLFVAQSNGSKASNYNAFMSALGATMTISDGKGAIGNATDIDGSTPYGAGVANFYLQGWNPITGGTPVVRIDGDVGVAFEDIEASAVPLPAAAPLLAGALALAGLVARRRA